MAFMVLILMKLNSQLIDISSFYNPNASLSELALKKSINTLKQEQQQQQTQPNENESKVNSQILTSDHDNTINGEDKTTLNEMHKSMEELIEEDCKIEKKGPLVVEF